MARRVRKRATTPPVSDDNPLGFLSTLSRASDASASTKEVEPKIGAESMVAEKRKPNVGGGRGGGRVVVPPKRRRVGAGSAAASASASAASAGLAASDKKPSGLVLPRKFTELAEMFDAVTKVADLRMRRGEAPLFSAIVAAAAGVYGKTSNDADLGKNIGVEHVRQMQKIADDMIRYVERGRSSTIEVLRPANEGPHRMNPIAMQSRRSRDFRKRLLRVTRRYYQRFLNKLPTEQRPDHDAGSAVKWDPRFDPNTIPDIPLAGAPAAARAPAAAAATAAPPPPPAARRIPRPTPSAVAPAVCGVGTPELVTPEPVDIRCTTGDVVEVQYGSTWYPAVVREMQGARGSGAPPREFFSRFHHRLAPFSTAANPLCVLNSQAFWSTCMGGTTRRMPGSRLHQRDCGGSKLQRTLRSHAARFLCRLLWQLLWQSSGTRITRYQESTC